MLPKAVPMDALSIVILLAGAAAVTAVAVSHVLIMRASASRLYDDLSMVPSNRVALVLGCSRALPGGKRNLYFRYRIEAARALLEAGKVESLLLSGGVGRDGFEEALVMRDALVEAGVPESRMQLDRAGFRTLDSVARAREEFGFDSFIVVSQKFQNRRAVFLARHLAIDAIGFNAMDVGLARGLATRSRELLAKVRAVLDVYVLGRRRLSSRAAERIRT